MKLMDTEGPPPPMVAPAGGEVGYTIRVPRPPGALEITLERRDPGETIAPSEGYRLDFGAVVILVKLAETT